MMDQRKMKMAVIDVKNNGLSITTYTSTTNATVNGSVSSCGNALDVFNDKDADTNVTVHGDVTSEDGRGIDLTNGIVRWPEDDYDNSNTKIIVDGNVYGGSMGAYLMNNFLRNRRRILVHIKSREYHVPRRLDGCCH